MPFLHDHRRRVPTQDIDRSVVVGMGAKAAGATVERRLAFAALSVHGSAGRTGLRGVARINLAQVSAPFFKFVGQHSLEAIPALVKDRPVQARLLENLGSGCLRRSLGAAGHVADSKVFQNDRAVAARKGETCLVPPILSDTRRARLQGRNTATGFGVARRATLSARHGALCPALCSLDLLDTSGQSQMFPRGERQRICNTPVNSNSGQVIGRGGVLDLTGKGDMPAVSRRADRYILDSAAQGPGVTELHPANLGQTRSRPLAVQAFRLDLPPLKAEGIVHSFPAWRGIACTAREEVDVSPVQIAQRLLLRCHMHRSDPVKLRAQHRQFTRLRDVVKLSSHVSLVVTPPVASLFKGKVVNQPHHASKLPEQNFLFRRRRELVSKGAVDHIASLAIWSEVCNRAI